jgi:putative FmdB family regulatory protein
MKPKWSRLGGIVPTYQYACTECGGQLEAVQKFTDAALTVHEDCGGRLRKVFSPVGIVFKGSGFYRTDSRGSEPKGSSSSVKENGSKDGGSKDGGSKDSGSKDSGSKESGSSSSSSDSASSSSKSGGDSSSSTASSSSGSSSSEKVA